MGVLVGNAEPASQRLLWGHTESGWLLPAAILIWYDSRRLAALILLWKEVQVFRIGSVIHCIHSLTTINQKRFFL